MARPVSPYTYLLGNWFHRVVHHRDESDYKSESALLEVVAIECVRFARLSVAKFGKRSAPLLRRTQDSERSMPRQHSRH